MWTLKTYLKCFLGKVFKKKKVMGMTCFKEASLVSRSSLNKTALNVMLLDVKNPDFANKDDTSIVSPQVSYFSC